jgi:GxxExxY protein
MAGRLIQTKYDDLTYRIIGCAMSVHTNLGPGLREDSYQRALEVVMTERSLSFEPQKVIPVSDGAQNQVVIGYYIPDFVVDDAVILEIKALDELDNAHLAQVIGYLAVTSCQVGLLVNFGRRRLEWRRILPPRDISTRVINRRWLFVPDWLRAEPPRQKRGTTDETRDVA